VSTAYAGRLGCPRCGREHEESSAFDLCAACEAQGQHVNALPVYELSRLAHGFRPDDTQPGLFKYRELLPLAPATVPVSLNEGGTPLLPIRRVAEQLGTGELYWKDESRNPTWSYKDRLAAVGITKAREAGAEVVVVSSTGNHGAAVAAYAAAAGIRCVALTIESVPLTMKVLMQSYGAHVVALKNPSDRWAIMRAAIRVHGWMPMSGFVDPPAGSNPFAVDGYKTMAYELVADLGRAPDVVITPVAYGDGIVGLLRGFADLLELGVITRVPRLVAAEVFGPYAGSAAGDPGRASRVAGGSSVAFSIATPVATFQGHQAIATSGGTAIATSHDGDILAAQGMLARLEGIYAEASSAIALTALRGLQARDELGPDDVVVCIGTSTGLKDVSATASTLPAVPVIEATLAALEHTMSAAS
jgi:threonine synthase